MGGLWQNIRFGARMLLRSPGFTLIAVLTLALGIGVNTAIFSMVNYIVLRPMPVRNPSQVVVLTLRQKNGPILDSFSVPEYRDIRDQVGGVFSGTAGYLFGVDGLSVNGKSAEISTFYVTGNFFSVMGLQPALGRFFKPSEGEVAGADPVVVLSYSYWQTRFGGDPNIIGRPASFDGRPVTIIGVGPKGFDGIFPVFAIQGFLPLGFAPAGNYPSDLMTNRGNRMIGVLGRLQEGGSLNQVQAQLAVVAERLRTQHPDVDKDLSLRAYPELESRAPPDSPNALKIISSLFLGLTAIVLLLACVNVANLLLVRATSRAREMAIRAALGARRARMMMQLLTESLLLALAGGAVGVVLGNWGSAALSSLDLQISRVTPINFPFDWRVFGYSLGAAILTGIIVGIVPAIRATRGDLNSVLHEGGRGVVGGRSRLRSALVVVQVAGSLMLLIVAALFTRSLFQVQHQNFGFEPRQVLDFGLNPAEIGDDDAQGIQFYKTLLSRVRALPGVESASLANSAPMGYISNVDSLTIDGYQSPDGQPAPVVQYNVVSPDYFKTMRIALHSGREFTDADNQTAAYVAVVSEGMARKFWPNQDPIGHVFRIASDMKHDVRIVGVAQDVRNHGFPHGLAGVIDPFFYMPLLQHYEYNSLEVLQVRTAAPPQVMLPEIQRQIQTLAPELPIQNVKPLTQALYTLDGLLIYELGAWLAAILGALGLILAVVGVYGVVSYSTQQQTHEIGVRMALGAQPREILRMVLHHGMGIVVGGVAFGLAGAFAAAHVVGSFLAVSAIDPVTYASVSFALALATLVACYVPARRATRVDPMVALRYE
ncbi:MAG TPA: ABC transporter permease [Methylomirabilota bacterium]|nr:ABC transporter permease [Methylomirabilota bacterium]